MNDIFKAIFIALVPSLIVAVITAKLTVNYSIKQFRTQKWWEKKHETYSKIVECLSKLLYCYREWTKAYDIGNPRRLSEDEVKKLSSKYYIAIEEFNEIANASVFNISESAANEIKKLRDEIENEFDSIDWYEDAGYKCELIENCIRDIKTYAKDDLNIDRF